MGDQEYNSGKKYRQKGTLCGPNTSQGVLIVLQVEKCLEIIVLAILEMGSDIRWARLPLARKQVEKLRNQLQS
jgi:hypothetical protein